MSEPWFDPNTFGAYCGAILGGGGGSLLGVIGGLAGYFLPRGRGRLVFPAIMAGAALFGLAILAVGVYALGVGQPYGIWHPLVLCGVIFGGVGGSTAFSLRRVARQIEQRRMEAQDLKHSETSRP